MSPATHFSKVEYHLICELLGRTPNEIELEIFSAMWSEHCSYRHSKMELKKLPFSGANVLIRAGEENSGVVDIGEGYAITFKMESHNHPSALEPFHGAATGVGGIVRDILAMGARPVLLMNSLRFGEIRGTTNEAKLSRKRFLEVVNGIAHYGNRIGVPNFGGEIYFDSGYQHNPLVNVFCLGVMPQAHIQKTGQVRESDPLFYIGNTTGRDGIAGAVFASKNLNRNKKKEELGAIQVGDPFYGKLLIEGCLELFRAENIVTGVQDMGAAGLACAACELASRNQLGVEIELDQIPQRDNLMIAQEILLSESQERMLLAINKEAEETIRKVAKKWGLNAEKIGKFTSNGLFRVKYQGIIVSEIPTRALIEEVPVCVPKTKPVLNLIESQKDESITSIYDSLLALLSCPDLSSKHWVYEQYDHMVLNQTMAPPGIDAAVIRVPFERSHELLYKYLAVVTEGNFVYCTADPCEGAKIAVAEAARNLTCVGARPLAMTDNLNFGDPNEPEVFWQFQHTIAGMAEAARFFETPVISGNVSFYNQSMQDPIPPTPVIGMVGIIDSSSHIITPWFKEEGDEIFLIGNGGLGYLEGTQYFREIIQNKTPYCPILDLNLERMVQSAIREAIKNGWIKSAHDCSDGGLGVALAECCIVHPYRLLGAEIILTETTLSFARQLFNEDQSRIIVTIDSKKNFTEYLQSKQIPFERIGRVGGKYLKISYGKSGVEWEVQSLKEKWWNALDKIIEAKQN